jgi:hypothetical protein
MKTVNELNKHLLSFFVLMTMGCTVLHASQSLATGGSSDRGGGNTLVCFSNPAAAARTITNKFVSDDDLSLVNSVKSLDLVEAELTGYSVAQAKPNESVQAYINRVIQQRILTTPYIGYNAWFLLKGLDTATFRYRNLPIKRVADESIAVDLEKSDCAIVTIASQITMGSATFVDIDNRLYLHPKHSLQSQAALLMHEAIYSFFRRRAQDSSSARTRFIVASLLNSNEQNKSASEIQFQSLIQVNDLNLFRNNVIKQYLSINYGSDRLTQQEYFSELNSSSYIKFPNEILFLVNLIFAQSVISVTPYSDIKVMYPAQYNFEDIDFVYDLSESLALSVANVEYKKSRDFNSAQLVFKKSMDRNVIQLVSKSKTIDPKRFQNWIEKYQQASLSCDLKPIFDLTDASAKGLSCKFTTSSGNKTETLPHPPQSRIIPAIK